MNKKVFYISLKLLIKINKKNNVKALLIKQQSKKRQSCEGWIKFARLHLFMNYICLFFLLHMSIMHKDLQFMKSSFVSSQTVLLAPLVKLRGTILTKTKSFLGLSSHSLLILEATLLEVTNLLATKDSFGNKKRITKIETNDKNVGKKLSVLIIAFGILFFLFLTLCNFSTTLNLLLFCSQNDLVPTTHKK